MALLLWEELLESPLWTLAVTMQSSPQGDPAILSVSWLVLDLLKVGSGLEASEWPWLSIGVGEKQHTCCLATYVALRNTMAAPDDTVTLPP